MRIVRLTAFAALIALAPGALAGQSFENCSQLNSAVAKTGLAGCNNPFLVGAGLDPNLYASTVTVSYFGSSAGNWHSMWAFKASDLVGGLPGNPVVNGTLLFCKFANCATNGGQANGQASVSFGWTTNTELIFAFFTTSAGGDGTPGSWGSGNWYFSGNPSRNADGKSHLAYFNSNGIYRDDRSTLIAGTNGVLGAVGFEDLTTAQGSDWDFNDAGFMWEVASAPTSAVPEPATMVLLASGLVGMAAVQYRRRKQSTK